MTATRTHKAALRCDSRSAMGYPGENQGLSWDCYQRRHIPKAIRPRYLRSSSLDMLLSLSDVNRDDYRRSRIILIATILVTFGANM